MLITVLHFEGSKRLQLKTEKDEGKTITHCPSKQPHSFTFGLESNRMKLKFVPIGPMASVPNFTSMSSGKHTLCRFGHQIKNKRYNLTVPVHLLS